MISRAVVESIVDKYHIRVRIPTLDKVSTVGSATKSDDLNIATICTLPSCAPNLRVGDVVFIAFEESTSRKAVILGCLFKDSFYGNCDMNVEELIVKTMCSLPKGTTIGDITYNELKTLKNSKENLKFQIDWLNTKIESLSKRLEKLEENKAE